MGWTVLDAPLDSSGAGRGEERAPQALRAAGLMSRLAARDAGRVDAVIRDATRDPVTGVIGAQDLRRGSALIARALAPVVGDAERRPLVLGGDCTLLLGVFGALPAGTALWMVDGHPDFHSGQTSPTGEGADMELSVLTGHGPHGLLERDDVLVDPAQVDLLGHRDAGDDPDARVEAGRVDPRVRRLTARELRTRGPAAVGTQVAGAADEPAWLHLDLDVLDERALPAVSYPQADGLGWDELVALAGPLARSARLVGLSVADFNPDRDPDGAAARRVVEALADLLG